MKTTKLIGRVIREALQALLTFLLDHLLIILQEEVGYMGATSGDFPFLFKEKSPNIISYYQYLGHTCT